MTKTLGGERYSVQKPLIGYVREPSAEYVTSEGKKVFINLGWDYVSPDEALRLRGGTTGFVFKELFINQMQALNSDFMNQELAEETYFKLPTSSVLPTEAKPSDQMSSFLSTAFRYF